MLLLFSIFEVLNWFSNYDSIIVLKLTIILAIFPKNNNKFAIILLI